MGLGLALEDVGAAHPTAKAGAAPVLRGLRFALSAGECVAVIGPSGAGKTSLLQLLACALRPSQGRLLIGGQDPWALAPRQLRLLRGQIFLAPQTPPLPPRQRVITALQAARLPRLSLWRSLRTLFYPDQVDAAHEALAQFDLAEKLWDRVDRLSGGERQRVALARALLSPADLWLIDEPLAALDPTRAQQVLDVLKTTAQARGITLLIALHQVEQAAGFARVLGLRDGALAFDCAGSELTPARLAALYAQREPGLAAAPVGADESAEEKLMPKVMVCR